MGYKISDIKIWQEDVFGVTPITPKVKLIKNTSFDVKKDEKSESIDFVGNGHQPNKKTYGSGSVSGTLGFVLSAEYMTLLLNGVVGEADTIADAVSISWEGSTAQVVTDIVNHTDDIHTLVCYTTGTTGTAEPDVSTLKDGETVVDGTVTWIVRDKLFLRSGELESCLPSFGIERKDVINCGAVDDHYNKYSGVVFSNLEVKKGDDDVKFDNSQAVLCKEAFNSWDSDEAYTPISAGTELPENFFNDEDVIVEFYINGSWEEIKYIDNINLDIKRENELPNNISKRVKFKKTTISGKLKGVMTKDLYTSCRLHQEFKVRFTYSKPNGDNIQVQFNSVEFGNPNEETPIDDDILLDIELTASGSSNVTAVEYSCISTLDI